MPKLVEEKIYEQWRKFLCLMITNEDVSYSQTYRETKLTAEQVRAIFNAGYRLAMAQTIDSLTEVVKQNSSHETLERIQRLIEHAQRREDVSNCLSLYKQHTSDEKMFEEAVNRKKQLDDCMSRAVCSWSGEEKM